MESNSSLEIPENCKKCHQPIDLLGNPAISCLGRCKQKTHIKCLVSNCLHGDVFYEYHCSECSESKQQIVVRQKLPWLTALILTLYNLKMNSMGPSRNNYFHYKTHIIPFISKNWDILFDKSFKRSTEWKGTISGYLSKYKEKFFNSGKSEFGKKGEGWWKLMGNDCPKVIVDNHKLEQQSKSAKAESKIQKKIKPDEKLLKRSRLELTSENGNQVQVNYNSEEFESRTKRNKLKLNTDEDFGFAKPNLDTDFPSFNFAVNSMDDFSIQSDLSLPDVFMSYSCDSPKNENDYSSKDEEIDITSSIETSIKDNGLSFQYINKTSLDESESDEDSEESILSEDEDEDEDENEDEESSDYPQGKPSLFTQSISKPLPSNKSNGINEDDKKPLMSIQEEEYYLDKFEKNKNFLGTAPPEVYRFYRRLVVRKQRRLLGLPILNIDTLEKRNEIMDEFFLKNYFFSNKNNIRLAGPGLMTSVFSPHTKRLLKPYIKIHEYDYSKSPLWFKVMTELLVKVNGKNSVQKLEQKAVIDYCYVKPQHISAINRLCSEFFFPVDVTDCLNYPDFTIVALYKKLIIGCGIMVPDAGCNESYISFLVVRPEWQNAGIGNAMMYHLYHSCMSSDITLHVSTSNPATSFYTKRGFKKEEYILNYYDKYLPPSSKESRNAFFYRLARDKS